MAKFKCVNSECKNLGKEIFLNRVKWLFNKQKEILEPSPPIICEICGDVLEYIKENKGVCSNIGKFNGMNDQQKKEVLKKRSRTHLQGRQKEEKEHYKQQAIKNYLGHG